MGLVVEFPHGHHGIATSCLLNKDKPEDKIISVITEFPCKVISISPFLEMCLDNLTPPLFGGHNNQNPLGV